MSRGILLIAHDTNLVSYGRLADFASNAIRKNLPELKITLITDFRTRITKSNFDHIIFQEIKDENIRFDVNTNQKNAWYNTDRSNAYILTPYDQTILIDVDYMVNTNILMKLFNQNIDFLCHNSMSSLTGNNFENSNTLGLTKIPFAWATVIYFKKSNYASNIFDLWNHVKVNWKYYTTLYNIPNESFRNDFALSIALHMANGQINHNRFIPWNLMNVPNQVQDIKIKWKNKRYNIEMCYDKYNDKLKYLQKQSILLTNNDMHFLNKDLFMKVAMIMGYESNE